MTETATFLEHRERIIQLENQVIQLSSAVVELQKKMKDED
jgi:hypothetical protein